MNKKFESVFGPLIIVVMMATMVGLADSAKELIEKSPEVLATILSATLLLLATIGGKILEKRMELQATNIVKKKEVYQKFIDVFHGVLNSEKSAAKTVSELRQINQSMFLWASADVIKKYNKFNEIMGQGELTGEENKSNLLKVMVALEDAVKAMRSDLGFDDADLSKFELSKLYIKRDEWNMFRG